jgi:predicted RNase H-like nuclease (RuvC/YqgF family)
MEGSKSIDVIIENYNIGQKKGRIFSYVLTLGVAVGILFTVFLGISLISKRYSLTQQTMAQELESKTNEIINIQNEIINIQKEKQDLTLNLDKSKVENAIFIKELEESKKEKATLKNLYEATQKENKSLKFVNKNLENTITKLNAKLKQIGFSTSVSSATIDNSR